MMSYNFPNSPAENQEFTPPGGVTYVWKTPRWLVSGLPPDSGGGGAATSIDISPPASPVAGQLWWDSDSDSGRLYIFYDDGNTSQWVEVVPPSGASKDYVDSNFLSLSGGTVTGHLKATNQLTQQKPAAGTTLWRNWLNELGYTEYSWRLDGTSNALYLRRYDGTASGLYRNALTITPTTGVDVAIGLNALFAVNAGVNFTAAPVASADPNVLDDYEEGVWTPVLVGLTTAGVGTYNTQSGRYTKIGRFVMVEAVLSWSAHTGTGVMQIQGLPFTVNSGMNPPASIWMGSMTFTGIPFLYFSSASTNANIHTFATGAANAGLAMDTSASITLSGMYTVA